MRGALDFDPAECDYGPATGAVRRILREWEAVDWFAPPPDDHAAGRAMALLREHNDLAHGHMPEVFSASLNVESELGGWETFADLCARVRAPGAWDWKYSALKVLSHRHAKAKGWSKDDEVVGAANLENGARPRPGALFVRVANVVFWTNVAPKVALHETLSPDRAAIAAWYLSYANMDVMEAIEWQLAERSDDVARNPFVRLLDCYATGFLPFAVDRDTFVVFALRDEVSAHDPRP